MEHFFRRPDTLSHPLHVITTIFNPIRYRTRWKLYQDFALMVERSGAILYTVEVAFGDREFTVTEPSNPRHLQLRTKAEIWHKENSLNLMVERLPRDWEKMAWVDADISFVRGDWANETLHQLEHYDVVQMWSHAADMSPDYEPLANHHSFVYSWEHDEPEPSNGYYGSTSPGLFSYHPGWAWAIRRAAFDQLGGLIDFAVLGAADNHMAKGLIGNADKSIHPDIVGPYRDLVMRWQDRASIYIKQNIGYVPGQLIHYHHGPKIKRGYWDRWNILVDCAFNPHTDLKRDWQGLNQFVVEDQRQIEMRAAMRKYFRQRDEDSLEV